MNYIKFNYISSIRKGGFWQEGIKNQTSSPWQLLILEAVYLFYLKDANLNFIVYHIKNKCFKNQHRWVNELQYLCGENRRVEKINYEKEEEKPNINKMVQNFQWFSDG